MGIVWIIGAVALAAICFFCALWCYFDPDDEFYDEKRQRKFVRYWLIGLFLSPIWPAAFVAITLFGIWKLAQFAFPRETEVE